MPEVSRFFGVVIAMYYDDHLPPHFHIKYAEHKAKMEIETLDLIKGNLPRRVLSLVLEWASLHRSELRENWQRARQGLTPNQIEGLE